jgi:LysR family nitrogen assimilation transcriptional regulator
LDIRQLRYFVAAVEVGSVTKAAHRLNISQPALGLQIRKLEDEFKTTLLTRHSRGVTLTAAGEKLYEHATLILRQTERATQDLLGFSGPLTGRVAIGLTPTANLLLAASLIELCSAELPNLDIRIFEGLGEENLALLAADRLDLALSYTNTASRDIECLPLIREDLFLICPLSEPGDHGDAIPFRELARRPLILPSQPHSLRSLLDSTAQQQDIALNITYQLDSMAPKKEMVQRGLGYTILPFGAVHREIQDGHLRARRIIQPELSRTLYLAHSRLHPRSKARDALEGLVYRLVEQHCTSENWHWRLAGRFAPPPNGVQNGETDTTIVEQEEQHV